MRVRFLALCESPHRNISLKQQAGCECESRRLREPPSPGTSTPLPPGHPPPQIQQTPGVPPAALRRCPALGATLDAPGPASLPGWDRCTLTVTPVLLRWYKDHFNTLAYAGLSNNPSQKRSPPVAKTACRRTCFSA